MEAGRPLIEILGNVVWSRGRVGRDAEIRAAGPQDAVYLGELMSGIVRVEVFHQLITVDEVHALIGKVHPGPVGHKKLHVGWSGRAVEQGVGDVDGDDPRAMGRHVDGESSITAPSGIIWRKRADCPAMYSVP